MSKKTNMQIKTSWIVTFVVLGLSIANPASSLYESDNYIIPKDTISSGGTYSISSNYSMTATIGQTSCIGRSSRGSLVLHSGFWTPEYFDLRPKALPFIPLLLLDE